MVEDDAYAYLAPRFSTPAGGARPVESGRLCRELFQDTVRLTARRLPSRSRRSSKLSRRSQDALRRYHLGTERAHRLQGPDARPTPQTDGTPARAPCQDDWAGLRAPRSVWARLPEGMDATALARQAVEASIILAPGNMFSPNLAPSPWLRFNVASVAIQGYTGFWRRPRQIRRRRSRQRRAAFELLNAASSCLRSSSHNLRTA